MAEAPPKTVELHVIYETASGEVKVHGPLHLKTMCTVALAQAIQIVATHKPPVIIPPHQGNGNKPPTLEVK